MRMVPEPAEPEYDPAVAPSARRHPVSPVSQTRAVLRLVLLLVLVAGALWLVYALEGVILLTLLSMLFAYLIAPAVDAIPRRVVWGHRRWPVPRPLAIAVVYVGLFAAMGIASAVLLPRLGAQLTDFGRQAPVYLSYARDQLQSWQRFVNLGTLPPEVRDAFDGSVARVVAAAGDSVSYGASSLLLLLGYLPWVLLVPVIAFFLLKDGHTFRESLLLALPTGRLRGLGAALLEDINETLAAYTRASLLASLAVGVTCTVGFLLIGVPYALLFGVVAGILELVPLVGPLIVAVGATLVVSVHSFRQAVVLLLFLGALRIAQDYVIFPRLVRRGIHMHPLAVILAILSGAELAGIPGICLAIPAVAVLSVLHRHLLAYRGTDGLVTELLQPVRAASVAADAIADSAN